MKIKLTVLALSFALTGSIGHAAIAADLETDMQQQVYEKIDVGVSLLDTVRSAVVAYYSTNMAWPANTSTLVNSQYVATVTAPWSSPVSGAVTASGRSFTLTLPAGNVAVAQGISAKMAGVVSGSNVSIIVPIPASAAINANNLSRIAVSGMPEVNRMFTDIDMNSNSLNNVNSVNALLINGKKAVLDDLVINTSLDVVPDAKFRRAVTVGTDLTVTNKVKSASVETNSLLVNGGAAVSSDLTAGSLKSTSDVIATRKVAGASAEFNTAVINGSLKAVSGVFDSVSLKDGTATNFTVNTFKALGVSDFAGDALFHGNVSIDGALSVLGIASAKDIREGGVLLKDKYLGIDAKSKDADKLDGLDSTAFAQLATANSFTGINSFTQVINANGGIAVDGKTVVSADGSTLYENGAALSSKYLGINAKAVSAGTADNATNAANADKLDGLDSTAFAQLAKDNTYTGKNTFTQAIYADGGVIVDGKTVVSADGSTLYENGMALSTKYLGINSTAADSKKLGGVDAGNFARKDVAQTFNGRQTFNNGIYVNDWVRVAGNEGLYFESYGGGFYMTDANLVRIYNNKSLFTTGSLYEGGQLLSDRYLGKTSKAVDSSHADSADNSTSLGGVAAANYARRDIANTFTATQTFNGGIVVNGATTLNDNATFNQEVYFKDSSGTTRSLKQAYASIQSLEAWKKACQIDVRSAACGLNISGDGGSSSGPVVVWTGNSLRVPITWGAGTYQVSAGKTVTVIVSATNTCGITKSSEDPNLDVRCNHTNRNEPGEFHAFYSVQYAGLVDTKITKVTKL